MRFSFSLQKYVVGCTDSCVWRIRSVNILLASLDHFSAPDNRAIEHTLLRVRFG